MVLTFSFCKTGFSQRLTWSQSFPENETHFQEMEKIQKIHFLLKPTSCKIHFYLNNPPKIHFLPILLPSESTSCKGELLEFTSCSVCFNRISLSWIGTHFLLNQIPSNVRIRAPTFTINLLHQEVYYRISVTLPVREWTQNPLPNWFITLKKQV